MTDALSDPRELLGSIISLISNSDIRYEGTLAHIDTQDGNIALRNVRSFGTEGRRQDGKPDIPPSTEVYEYIIFKGNDIKDLHILRGAEAQAPPQKLEDPAIVSAMPHGHMGPPMGGFPPHGMPYGMPPPGPGGYRPPGPYGPGPGMNTFGMPPHMHGPNMPMMPMGYGPGAPPPPTGPTGAPGQPTDGGGAPKAAEGAPEKDDGASKPPAGGAPAQAPPGAAQSVPDAQNGRAEESHQPARVETVPGGAAGDSRSDDKQAGPKPAPTVQVVQRGQGAGRGGRGGDFWDAPGGRGGWRGGRGGDLWDMPGGRGGRGEGRRGRWDGAPRGRGRGRGRMGGKLIEVPKEDFDLEAANQRFAREGEEEAGKAEAQYKKDDFFDCLSNEAAEPQVPKLSREEFRATMDEKRKLDVETFGDMAASYRPSFLRNRGRGRGRGGPRGRGRYMGGGRAGGGF